MRHDPGSVKPTALTIAWNGTLAPASAQVSPPPNPPTGPAVKTAAGRVFYGGGGITPDIDAKPMTFTPMRNRIAEAAFHFTRQLAAGLVPGLESLQSREDSIR